MKYRASATLEATLLMPVLILFFGSFIWFIDVFRIHSGIGTLLAEAGEQMVAYSYAYNTVISGEDAELIDIAASMGWSEGILRNRIMSEDYSKRIQGLSITHYPIKANGEIRVKVFYYVQPYVSLHGYKGMLLSNSFYSKAYIGNAQEEEDDEKETEYVYITKNSEVYHSGEECRSLCRNVVTIKYENLEQERNLVRGKYYCCSKCGKNAPGIYVYVTPQGNRYHTDENCSELTVTIYKVPLEEVGERRKCYYCQWK